MECCALNAKSGKSRTVRNPNSGTSATRKWSAWRHSVLSLIRSGRLVQYIGHDNGKTIPSGHNCRDVTQRDFINTQYEILDTALGTIYSGVMKKASVPGRENETF